MATSRARALLLLLLLAATACGSGSGTTDSGQRDEDAAEAEPGDAGEHARDAQEGVSDASGDGLDGAAERDASDGSASGDSALADGGKGDGASGDGACDAIPTFEQGKTPSKTIHVATSGNDGSGNGSPQSPYATLARAASAAEAGSAIVIHAGTYPGGTFLSNLVGSASAPIWIGGAPNESRPVLQGGAEGLHIAKANYLVLHDLELRDQTANGLNLDDGGEYDDSNATNHVVMRGLFIHDVGSGGNQDCLKLSGVNHYFVLDSEFARCGGGDSGSAIDHVGCHDGVIARNRFEELTGGGNAIQCKGGSANIEIRANRIRNAGQRAINMGGSTGFEFFRPPLSTTAPNVEARDIRVIANLIVGGITPFGFVGCVDCVAANNTIVDPERWALRILQETTSAQGYTFLPARAGRVINNIFYFARGSMGTTINVGANTDAASFEFRNNLWYAHDDPTRSMPTGLPSAESGGSYGQNPAFLAGTDTYAIGPASPAAGSGAALAELSGDVTGACFAQPPSRGAFEVR